MSIAPVRSREREESEQPGAVIPIRAETQAGALYEFADIVELPRRARATLYLVAVLLLAAIAWAAFAHVDMVVSAEGKLTTRQQLTVVQPFELSVVRNIAVRVGERVRAGQTLATLDPTYVQADVGDAAAKLNTSKAALARIKAETANRDYDPPDPDEAERSQREIFLKRRAETEDRARVTRDKVRDLQSQLAAKQTELAQLKDQARFAVASERIYEELVDRGVGSKLKLLTAQRTAAQVRGEVVSNEGKQRSLHEQIETAKAELASYMSERTRKLADEYAKASIDYNDALAKLTKAQMRKSLVALKAPIDGTVLQIADRANGSVVREAETLFTLVPRDSKIVADLRVNTRDIAHLKVGQPVTLKLEALPYQQFGYLKGRLAVIAPDTLSDDTADGRGSGAFASAGSSGASGQPQVYYHVRVEIERDKLRNLPAGFVFRPGMRVTGDIKVGERSILQYIFNPITRGLDESLREP